MIDPDDDKPRVLIVDDERLMRWSLRECLADAGYDVVEAPDGQSALQSVATDGDRLRLVLLDLRLPDADGLSLLKRIRAAAFRCPIILMTAYGSPEVDQAARAAGVFDVVSKPFNLDDMVRLARAALQARGSAPW